LAREPSGSGAGSLWTAGQKACKEGATAGIFRAPRPNSHEPAYLSAGASRQVLRRVDGL